MDLYRRQLAKGYDPVRGSRVLGVRFAAHRRNTAEGRTAAGRTPSTRKAA